MQIYLQQNQEYLLKELEPSGNTCLSALNDSGRSLEWIPGLKPSS